MHGSCLSAFFGRLLFYSSYHRIRVLLPCKVKHEEGESCVLGGCSWFVAVAGAVRRVVWWAWKRGARATRNVGAGSSILELWSAWPIQSVESVQK